MGLQVCHADHYIRIQHYFRYSVLRSGQGMRGFDSSVRDIVKVNKLGSSILNGQFGSPYSHGRNSVGVSRGFADDDPLGSRLLAQEGDCSGDPAIRVRGSKILRSPVPSG